MESNVKIRNLVEIASKLREVGKRGECEKLSREICYASKSQIDDHAIEELKKKTIEAGNPITTSSLMILQIRRGTTIDKAKVKQILGALRTEGEWAAHDALLSEALISSADVQATVTFYFDALNRSNLSVCEMILKFLKEKISHNLFNEMEFCLFVAQRKSTNNLTPIARNLKLQRLTSVEPLCWFFLIYLKEISVNERELLLHKMIQMIAISSIKPPIIADILVFLWLYRCEGLALSLTYRLFDSLLQDRDALKSSRLVRIVAYSLQKDKSHASVELLIEKQQCLCDDEVKSIRLKGILLDEENLIKLDTRVSHEHVNQKKTSKRYLEFPFLIYGEDYLFYFSSFTLKSLTTSEDFAELCQKFDVRFVITTLPEHYQALIRIIFPHAKKFGFEFAFDLELLRSPTSAIYFRTLFLLKAILRTESKDGVIVSLCADCIIGNGLLNQVELCPEGGGAGGGLIRASAHHIMIDQKNGKLDHILSSTCRNQLLATHASSDWKHHFQRLYTENLSPIFNSVREGSEIVTSGFSGPPIVIKPSDSLAKRFVLNSKIRYSNPFLEHVAQYIDHEFVSELHNANRLHTVYDIREFVMIEMSSATGYSSISKACLPIHSFDVVPPITKVFSNFCGYPAP